MIHLLPAAAAFDPAYLAEEIVLGLSLGAIYALIALGYTMVYGIIELINFAHGDVFTVGAFISLAIVTALPGVFAGVWLIPALVLLFVVTMSLNGLLGVAIERVAYRRLRNSPRLAPLITAVGMSFLLEGILYIREGPSNHHYPELIPNTGFNVLGVSVTLSEIVVILTAVGLMLALRTFIQGTRLGKAMRATAQDRDAAQLMGINIDRTIALTFFIGSALAGAGGIINGLYYNNIKFDDGFEYGIIAFTSAVFGGIGNITGAAVGGFLIGLVFSLTAGYVSVQWTDVVIFSVLILVLVFKPTGLMGMRVGEKA